jgi:hypothetical protein
VQGSADLSREAPRRVPRHSARAEVCAQPKAGQPQEEWTLAIKNGKPFDFMSQFDYSVRSRNSA